MDRGPEIWEGQLLSLKPTVVTGSAQPQFPFLLVTREIVRETRVA